MKPARQRIGIALALIVSAVTSEVTAQRPSRTQDLDQRLDRIAYQLARLLQIPAFRALVLEQIRTSVDREQILVLDSVLMDVKGRADVPQDLLNTLMESVGGTRQEMKAAGFSDHFASVDLYFPVADHRRKWQGDEELLVAFASVEDEAKVSGVTAYSIRNLQRVNLDPKSPPPMPTLVIAQEEHEDHRRLAPLEILPSPRSEMDTGRGPPEHDEHSFIGISELRILNDHEPWYRGDPEIYVLVGQSNQKEPIKHKIWLNSGVADVNEENHWYWLGAGAGFPLYFYFDNKYSDGTYYHFWESDGGTSIPVNASVSYAGATVTLSFTIRDGDDDMGSRYVNKSSVAWSGFLLQSTGDVQFYVDKNH